MIRKAALLVVAMACAGSVPAGAQTAKQVDARYSRDYDRCLKTGDAARGVTSAMMDCTGLENERQDARLNQAYKMVMTRLSPKAKGVLRTSQRNWIKQRDARCRSAAAEMEGGSASGLIFSGCFLDETVKRTMWLERYKG